MNLLDIRELSINFGRRRVVDGVSMCLRPGEKLGVIGESGSGKTMIGRAILGLLPAGGQVSGGEIRFDGKSVAEMDNCALRRIRGAEIGMIFQEPMVSLNPGLTIGRQMTEGLRLHRGIGQREADGLAEQMLEKVRFRDPRGALAQYPHEFSGGMRQRIMLASVLMLEPRLLIADEPTTALDAIIQNEVMDLMSSLVEEMGTALLLVSHDLPLVARHVDRAAIMRAGELVEEGPVRQVLASPSEAYTARLVAALPVPKTGHVRDTPPLVEARGMRVIFAGRKRAALPWRPVPPVVAVDDISLTVHQGEILGLVGESGSGKSTLGRAILGLVERQGGEVLLEGKPLSRDFRRDMQIVFQDPFSSLNPRRTIRTIVNEALRHVSLPAAERRRRIDAILDRVQLPHGIYGDRLPHQLSGGQRQRVCIARALVPNPRFVVADEAVSALDLTVQKEVLQLFRDLQQEMGFAALFISHDMAVIEEVADRIVVMKHGQIVEQAPGNVLMADPRHPYTRKLLGAVPEIHRVGDRVEVRQRHFDDTREMPARQSGGTGAPSRLLEIAAGHFVRR